MPLLIRRINLNKFQLFQIPRDEEGMKKWLYDRWVEKDNFLEEFSQTGEFPKYGKMKPTLIKLDKRGIIYGTIYWAGSLLIFNLLALLMWHIIRDYINTDELFEPWTRK